MVFYCYHISKADINATGGFAAPYFQADYIQDISEFNAALINPALLFRVNQFRLEAGFYRWGGFNPVGEELGYNQGTFLSPLFLKHTLGISVIGSGSEFTASILDEKDKQPKDTGQSRFLELWVIGHYSYRILPWLSVGANPKFVAQNQFEKYSYGFGLDVGFYANIFDHYRYGDLGVSFTFQDIIPANLAWKNQSGEETAWQLMTTRFRGGIRYAVMNDRLVFDMEGVIDNLFQQMWDGLIDLTEKGEIDSITGALIKKDDSYLDKIGRISFHTRFQWIPQLWFKVGWANNNIPYIGFNVNIIYLWPEMINYASVDIHYGYSINEQERGSTFMVRLATDFGPTREQRESRRLYEKLVLAPMNAYNEAMRLYVAKKYWEASFAFGKVISLFPNFHLSDKATYYLGDCYTQMRLHGIGREVFKEALSEYTTSEVRANFLYGLQLIDFREGKYRSALKNHSFISNLYPESDIKPDADYLAGQIHFIQKNFSAAQQNLSAVPPDTRPYKYAQYTLAVINIENSKVKAAIENLMNIISDRKEDDDDATRLIIHAAEVKLGQLYFEEVELRHAVEIFKRVPENFPLGDEALLGIAWSWIKVNRPQECLNSIERIISLHPKSPLVPEAYLVKGYSLMLMRQNRPARDAFNTCIELCKNEFASDDDFKVRQEKFDQYVVEFGPTADRIKKNALRKPTDKIVAERAELYGEFEKYAKESNDFFIFSLIVEDNKKFFRRKNDLLQDAEYALAKLAKMIESQEEDKIIEKGQEKQEKLDSEIEKLRQKLEKLEE
jgi:TolA-binding protein